MIFLVSYLLVAVVSAVIFAVSIATLENFRSEDVEDWMMCGFFGLMVGLLWPLTLTAFVVMKVARRIYYASRENNVV